jgi:heptaprenyl diphosphate synthase
MQAVLQLPDHVALREVCRDTMAMPGEQVRAALLNEASKVGPRTRPADVELGFIGLEALHVASLNHDDVMDAADLRRNLPAIWCGHGPRMAFLSGSWLLARACELLSAVPVAAQQTFVDGAVELVRGQMVETGDLFRVDKTFARYLHAIDGKTACLFWLACRMGAQLGEAPDDIADHLGRFGRFVGLAFQISDDILDILGAEDDTGKRIGTDLRRGVVTLPVLFALEEDPSLVEVLDYVDDAGVARVQEAMRTTEAIGRCMAASREQVELALAELEAVPRHDNFVALAHYAAERPLGTVSS